jgi:hypothetical protein
LRADYLMSETWVLQDESWRLAMVHAYVVAKDPPALPMADGELAEYVGKYQAAPDLSYVISREGDHLVGKSERGLPLKLAKESRDVLFIPGRPREKKLFRRDARNQILEFVDRREGEDLLYVRVPRSGS